MTRKDYKLIARHMRGLYMELDSKYKYSALVHFNDAIRNLMNDLQGENPQFNKQKFIQAIYEGKGI